MRWGRRRPDTLPVTLAGDPVLRRLARPVEAAELLTPALGELIERMRATMHAAPGVGLAAPQVGVPLRLVVIEDRAEGPRDEMSRVERRPVPFTVLVNPEIVARDERQVEFFEGCLSVPPFRALVPRASSVRVRALDGSGNPVEFVAQGWHARIVQHEIDHLDGILYLDRMHSRSFTTADNLARFWSSKDVMAIKRELGIADVE